MFIHNVRFGARMAALAVILACKDLAPTAATPVRPAPFLIVTQNNVTLQVPRTLQVEWRGGSDSDAPSWESADDAIASVSSSGMITAKFPGSTTITARRGLESATLSVNATAATVDISPEIAVLALDSLQSLTAIVRDANGSALAGVPVSWSTGNTKVVTVDTLTGALTPIARGATTVTAVGGGARGTVSVYIDLTVEQVRFSAIGSLSNHTCAIEAPTGFAYCWGDNHAGALGNGGQEAWDWPMRVSGDLRFTSLSVGDYGTCGIEAVTAVAYCWGSNHFGDLGDGTYNTAWEPTLVAAGRIRFTRISASGTHTCGVEAATGLAYCWGKEGLIGDGTRLSQPTPTVVGNGETRITFSEVSAGASHTCGVEQGTGAAFCWGRNFTGQLGDGTLLDRLEPQPAVAAPALRFTSISAGWTLSCAITDTGLAYCWGANPYGQIGDGTTVDRLEPTLVGGGRQHFNSISATGAANACALEAQTGFAYCWGRYVGEAGDSASAYRTEPTLVRGGTRRFSSVVATYRGGCGIEAETGISYCWSYSQMIPATILPPVPEPLVSPE
jgi:alpha-tubulin suppressor-like RCC1 family protein